MRRQKWDALLCADAGLLCLAVYCACFTVFACASAVPQGALAGPFGGITAAGRIAAMCRETLTVFALLSVPYAAVHFRRLCRVCGEPFTRYAEKLTADGDCLTYTYRDILSPGVLHTETVSRRDAESVSFLDRTEKLIVGGPSVHRTETKDGKVTEKKEDSFSIYGYFEPDILQWFGETGVKTEITFCGSF